MIGGERPKSITSRVTLKKETASAMKRRGENQMIYQRRRARQPGSKKKSLCSSLREDGAVRERGVE